MRHLRALSLTRLPHDSIAFEPWALPTLPHQSLPTCLATLTVANKPLPTVSLTNRGQISCPTGMVLIVAELPVKWHWYSLPCSWQIVAYSRTFRIKHGICALQYHTHGLSCIDSWQIREFRLRLMLFQDQVKRAGSCGLVMVRAQSPYLTRSLDTFSSLDSSYLLRSWTFLNLFHGVHITLQRHRLNSVPSPAAQVHPGWR